MRTSAFLSVFLLPAALVAQAPAPSLGERVKAERPVIEKLQAELNYSEALKRAEALLPATRPVFDKKDNTTLVQSCAANLDMAEALRLAAEAADSAGAWEKALDFAKTAKSLATEANDGIKEPFSQTVAYYAQAGVRAKEILQENQDRIKSLKERKDLDPGERQELDLAIGVEKEVVESAKWVKFFQTYLDVTKRTSESYDPLVKVMEEKLKGEASQIEEYKAGKGEKTKWVEAVISTPAYLERFTEKSGKAQWLNRLAFLDPDSKKVQHQLDILSGKATAAPVKPAKKGK